MKFTIKKDNKILILMLYYNRPQKVINALNSIKNQKYKNWVLAFVDDGSDEPGENIVKSFFDEEELKKTTFYNTNETKEIKNNRGKEYSSIDGSEDRNSGAFPIPKFNNAMQDHNFDIAFFLCDDDCLCDDYLEKLNIFYNTNPDTIYSYCNVILFDSKFQNPKDSNITDHRFYRKGKINGYNNLDSSQVSWRSSIFKKDNVKFDETFHSFFDAAWYKKLYINYGPCEPNFLIGQYKDFDRNIFDL